MVAFDEPLRRELEPNTHGAAGTSNAESGSDGVENAQPLPLSAYSCATSVSPRPTDDQGPSAAPAQPCIKSAMRRPAQAGGGGGATPSPAWSLLKKRLRFGEPDSEWRGRASAKGELAGLGRGAGQTSHYGVGPKLAINSSRTSGTQSDADERSGSKASPDPQRVAGRGKIRAKLEDDSQYIEIYGPNTRLRIEIQGHAGHAASGTPDQKIDGFSGGNGAEAKCLVSSRDGPAKCHQPADSKGANTSEPSTNRATERTTQTDDAPSERNCRLSALPILEGDYRIPVRPRIADSGTQSEDWRHFGRVDARMGSSVASCPNLLPVTDTSGALHGGRCGLSAAPLDRGADAGVLFDVAPNASEARGDDTGHRWAPNSGSPDAASKMPATPAVRDKEVSERESGKRPKLSLSKMSRVDIEWPESTLSNRFAYVTQGSQASESPCGHFETSRKDVEAARRANFDADANHRPTIAARRASLPRKAPLEETPWDAPDGGRHRASAADGSESDAQPLVGVPDQLASRLQGPPSCRSGDAGGTATDVEGAKGALARGRLSGDSDSPAPRELARRQQLVGDRQSDQVVRQTRGPPILGEREKAAVPEHKWMWSSGHAGLPTSSEYRDDMEHEAAQIPPVGEASFVAPETRRDSENRRGVGETQYGVHQAPLAPRAPHCSPPPETAAGSSGRKASAGFAKPAGGGQRKASLRGEAAGVICIADPERASGLWDSRDAAAFTVYRAVVGGAEYPLKRSVECCSAPSERSEKDGKVPDSYLPSPLPLHVLEGKVVSGQDSTTRHSRHLSGEGQVVSGQDSTTRQSWHLSGRYSCGLSLEKQQQRTFDGHDNAGVAQFAQDQTILPGGTGVDPISDSSSLRHAHSLSFYSKSGEAAHDSSLADFFLKDRKLRNTTSSSDSRNGVGQRQQHAEEAAAPPELAAWIPSMPADALERTAFESEGSNASAAKVRDSREAAKYRRPADNSTALDGLIPVLPVKTRISSAVSADSKTSADGGSRCANNRLTQLPLQAHRESKQSRNSDKTAEPLPSGNRPQYPLMYESENAADKAVPRDEPAKRSATKRSLATPASPRRPCDNLKAGPSVGLGSERVQPIFHPPSWQDSVDAECVRPRNGVIDVPTLIVDGRPHPEAMKDRAEEMVPQKLARSAAETESRVPDTHSSGLTAKGWLPALTETSLKQEPVKQNLLQIPNKSNNGKRSDGSSSGSSGSSGSSNGASSSNGAPSSSNGASSSSNDASSSGASGSGSSTAGSSEPVSNNGGSGGGSGSSNTDSGSDSSGNSGRGVRGHNGSGSGGVSGGQCSDHNGGIGGSECDNVSRGGLASSGLASAGFGCSSGSPQAVPSHRRPFQKSQEQLSPGTQPRQQHDAKEDSKMKKRQKQLRGDVGTPMTGGRQFYFAALEATGNETRHENEPRRFASLPISGESWHRSYAAGAAATEVNGAVDCRLRKLGLGGGRTRCCGSPACAAQAEQELKFTAFQRKVLKVHNDVRKMHSAPALALSESICLIATRHAVSMAQAVLRGAMTSPPSSRLHRGQPCGENVAYVEGPVGTNDDAVDDIFTSWYRESLTHDFKSGKFNPNTARFTQMVWMASREIGVGRTRIVIKPGACRAHRGPELYERIYVVVNYYPKGNVDCNYTHNVRERNTA